MKIKLDFVTNSSSASFILFVESMETDLESFKIQLKKIMDRYIQNEVPYIEGYGYGYGYDEEYETKKARHQKQIDNILNTVQQITKHTYRFENYTSMLNSLLQDLPSVMNWMVLESMIGSFIYDGIKEIRLVVEDEAGGHYNI